MAKRKQADSSGVKVTGGSHTLAARGLVPIQSTVTPQQKRKYTAAAGLAGKRLRDWINDLLDAGADVELRARGVDPESLT